MYCAILYSGNFLTTFRDQYLETSVRNYHNSLRNTPEERSSRLLRGGSLQSRTHAVVNSCADVCCRVQLIISLAVLTQHA